MLSSRRTGQALAAILISLVLSVTGQLDRTGAAQVTENSYISPNFGYSISWDETWFVAEESSSSDYDLLALTNGLTHCTLVGGRDPSTLPEAGLAQYVAAVRTHDGVSDFKPLLDQDGNAIRFSDAQHAFAAFMSTIMLDDGSEFSVATYIEYRLITPGEVALAFIAAMPAADFESERPQFEQLLANIRPELNSSHTDQQIANGEPAPVFVSGRWRVAVASVSDSPTFADLDLRKKTGKEWVLAIVDVTNWSEQDATISARDFTIQTGDGQKPAKIARSSVLRLSNTLGTTPFAEDLSLEVAGGQTVRVALAFVIPAGTTSPALAIGEDAMPLTDFIRSDFQADRLPAAVTPPALTEGTIVSASDGRTVRIKMAGESKSTRFRLLGVDPPAEDSCFANFAESLIDDQAGATVLVEEDDAITTGKPPGRYVWLIGADGQRRLLNQKLIAVGFANADELPADARFGTWFAITESTAREADAGLWAGCAPSTPTPRPTSTATPKPSATATATPKPSATATATPKPSATATATAKPQATASATPAQTSPTSTPKPVHSSPTPKPSPTKSAGMQVAWREGGHG